MLYRLIRQALRTALVCDVPPNALMGTADFSSIYILFRIFSVHTVV